MTDLEIIPLQHLEKLDELGCWRSTSHDPAFLLRSQNGLRLRGWTQFSIELEYFESLRRPRLYWDDGQGFNEKKSYLLLTPNEGRLCFVVPLPRDVMALRLDPSDGPDRFRLSRVQVRPLFKVIAAYELTKPYLKKVFRNWRHYRGFFQETLLVFQKKGLAPFKIALGKLILAPNSSGARHYIHTEYLSLCHDGEAYKKTATHASTSVASSAVIARCSATQRNQRSIGIGLIEHMGDIVACEPVARYLKRKNPKSRLVWVVKAPYRELIQYNPYVDEVVVVDCLTDWIKLIYHGVYEEFVDLHIEGRICQDCGVPLRKMRGNTNVTGDNYFNYGSLLKSFCIGAGIEPLDDQPCVYIPESVRQTVDQLNLPEKFVIFHCFSNDPNKDWAAGKWHELALRFQKTNGFPIIEIGLSPILREGLGRTDLCGHLSILETAEVIRRSSLFVGVDSGPAHLANAVQAHGVVLLGEFNRFKKYNPYTGAYAHGDRATLVHNENGPAVNLSLDSVFQAVEERLKISTESALHADKDLKVNEKIEIPAGMNEISSEAPRPIAFYLPQFHPIPENDKHWGKGFTEWRNVAKATSFYDGQYQPRLPGELGHYDLRVPEVMEQQAALARAYGLFGFCYYLYWFQGKRLLNTPVDRMLRSKKPDFPFCFCWANENWNRRWDGHDEEVLIAQEHSPQDDLNFIRHLFPAFDDPRYIRVNGKPLLLVYRTELFPNPLKTSETWRSEARKAGFKDIYLVRCEGFDPWTNPGTIGFDASYEVPTFTLPNELLYDRIHELNVSLKFKGRIFDYKKIVQFCSDREDVSYKRYKAAMLAWDNTPRHGDRAVIFHGATPELYGQWLKSNLQWTARRFEGEESLVFINAWNEWAEGSYLEPDLKFGRGFLEATRDAVGEISLPRRKPGQSPSYADR